MSRREKMLKRDLVNAIKKGGGSFKTVSDYSKILQRVGSRLAELNIQIKSVEQIKVRHVELYMHSRKSDEVANRTLQNEMTAIRRALDLSGKTLMADPKHERLSNKALGIAGGSRKGTKEAISDSRYREVLGRVQQVDKGVAAAMQLSRYLGLRNEEAVQSAKSLKTWQKALMRGDEKLQVIFGTKGGRARMTTVVDRPKVLEAVNNALSHCERQNGKLIEKKELKSALNHYINVLRRGGELAGGKETPHSLRYSYARDAMHFHIMNGYSYKEALALTSMDLGHGDGRGTYIENVYCQKM